MNKMKILIIGAAGTIGKIISPALQQKHEIISAGRNSGEIKVDLSSSDSIEAMFNQIKNIDACVCVAGDSYTGDLLSLTEEHLNLGIKNKLIGQANLVLIGQKYLNDNGSFTLISGKMGDKPVKNNAAKAIVNGGVNSFAMAASLEMPRGLRINAVSPSKVADIPINDLINGYLKSIEGEANGEIIKINY
jgi:NAD(P)-dependent dehydrogenase (short-subunit alcohol dehydrogenase family)